MTEADEGISGTTTYRRDEFKRMLQDCRNGKIDLIMTKSISRFARNTLECIQVIRELKKMGIGIYFEKERIHTLSAESELALTIYSSVAQEESTSISQNVRWAVQKRMKDGSWLIPCIAYGYERDGNGELIPRNPEAEIVKEIYKLYISGQGCYVIAMNLNRRGVLSPKGNAWTEGVIREILLNDIYVGDLICQKYFNEDMLPHKKRKNEGQYPMYLISDDHEAIISREQKELVKEIMALRKKLSGMGARPGMYQERYPFSGKLICGECGSYYKRRKIKVTESNQYIQWTCKTHIVNKETCGMTGVREDYIEKAFIRLTRKLHDYVKVLLVPLVTDIKQMNVNEAVQIKVNEYNNKVLDMERQIQMFRRHVSEGTMDTAIFIQKYQQIKGEISYLKELRNRELEMGACDSVIITELEYLIRCVRGNIEQGEFNTELFNQIVKQVVIKKDKSLEFHLISGLCLTEDG